MKVILASSSPRRLDLLHQLGWEAEVFPRPFNEVKTVSEAEAAVKRAVKAKVEAEAAAGANAGADRKRHSRATSMEASTAVLSNASSEASSQNKRIIFSGEELFLLENYRGAEAVPAYNALGKAKATVCVTGDRKPVIGADTVVIAQEKILGKPQSATDAKDMLLTLSGTTHLVKTAVAIFYQGKINLRVVTTAVKFRTLTPEEIAWYVSTGEPMDKAGAYGIQGKGTFLVERIIGNYDNVVGLPVTDVYEMLQELMECSLLPD